MSSVHQVFLAVIRRFLKANFKKSIVLSYDIAEETIEKIGGLFLFSEGSPYLREWIVFLGEQILKKVLTNSF